MTYEFYKILHYISIFIVISGITASFMLENPPKVMKILTGISSLLLFVAGMGLISKGLNLPHGEAWPVWIYVKISLWLLVAVGAPVLGKRLGSGRGIALALLLLLLFVAAGIAVTKPF